LLYFNPTLPRCPFCSPLHAVVSGDEGGADSGGGGDDDDDDDVDKDEYRDAFDVEEEPAPLSPDEVKAAEAAMKAQHDVLSMEWQVCAACAVCFQRTLLCPATSSTATAAATAGTPRHPTVKAHQGTMQRSLVVHLPRALHPSVPVVMAMPAVADSLPQRRKDDVVDDADLHTLLKKVS